jgi:hypothetical protein
MRVALAAVALVSAAALGQRVGDYRDPGQNYTEGWTSLFNGKDVGRSLAGGEPGGGWKARITQSR